ncbi:RAD51 protein [Ceratobasidium theobromae]|uniref:RAD51 protein n=1 Tax=Ceratobasidium theobromae TaxID=1582974 RepID=A0A5N5QJJ3_9AGAM|nr:RAD51 protein [Ceratobasidium theobromae]
MRIRTIHKNIPLLISKPHILPALEASGIKTTYDLLFTPLPDILARLCARAAEDVLTEDIVTLQDEIAVACAAPGIRGDQLVEKELSDMETMKPQTFAPLGVQSVDNLLGETLYGPYVVEISGLAGSGKSTIALQVVIRRLAHDDESSALWIDCSGDFAGERARRMCQALGLDNDAASATLQRLQVVLSFEMDQFQTTLDSVEASLSETPEASMRYIVVDPITPLLAGQITGSSSQGHATMTSTMRQLARIAQEHKITILVINRTATAAIHNSLSSFPGVTAKPALGPTFTFLAHATIWLSTASAALGRGHTERPRPEGGQTHIVEVFRSRVGLSHQWGTFYIQDGVVVENRDEF